MSSASTSVAAAAPLQPFPSDGRAPATAALYVEVALLSLATLLLEVSYTRVFSFKLFYYFTYLIIGIALLGLGAGGVLVTVSARIRRHSSSTVLAVCCLVAGATVLLGYVVVARVQLNGLALARSIAPGVIFDASVALHEGARLVVICAAVFAPFLAAGIALSKVFSAHTEDVNRLYFADLLGAGIGCAVAVPLLSLLTPPGCVQLAGLAFVLAAARTSARSRLAAVALPLGLALGAAVLVPGRLPDVAPDGVKTLARKDELHIPVIFTRWSPVFRVDVLPNPMNPDFYVLAHDGMWGSIMLRHDGDPSSHRAFETDPRSYPFRVLAPSPSVAIIGAAGGHEILASLYFKARHVDAVELNPVTVHLLTTDFADFTGHLADDPRVNLVNGEGRSFLSREPGRYDLVWMVAPDSYAAMNAATSGAFVLSESYLYTTEMVRQSLAHLTPDGVICAQFGEFNFDRRPARTLRYLATARAALAEAGIADFARHVLVSTTPAFGPQYSTILIKRAAFTDDEIARFTSATHGVEGAIVRHPAEDGGDGPVERAITLPSAELAAWYRDSAFRVGPVTDDAPFFWHFVRFRDALLGSERTTLDPEDATGERLLLVLFAVSVAFAAAFLLLPLLALRRVWRAVPYKGRAGLFFAAIGIGFMLLEITLIQRLTLLLGYPTYTLTVTLFSLLISTGVGSLLAQRAPDRRRALLRIVPALALLFAFYGWGLAPLVATCMSAPFAARVAIAIALLAPLGLCVGGFMPLGLRTVSGLGDHGQEYVAWAWSVNGFCSVTSSVLATILAMAFGFHAVLLVAVAAYAVAIVALLTLPEPRFETR